MSPKPNLENTNPLLYLFRKRFQYAERKLKIIGIWTMFLIAESIDLFLEPFIWSRVVVIISTEGITEMNIHKLYFYLLLYLLKTFSFWAIHGPARLIEQTQAFLTRTKYRDFLLKGLFNLPLEWHTEHHSGETIDRTNRGANALYDFSEETFQVIYALVRLVISYVMLVIFSPSASWIALIFMMLGIWITLRFDRILIHRYIELNEKENKISESIFDAISNISTVIILRVEGLIFDAIMHKVREPYTLTKRTAFLNEWKWALTSFACAFMTVFVFGAYFMHNIGVDKAALVASTYLLISYLNKVSELFFSFTSMYGGIVRRKSRVMNAEKIAEDFRLQSFTNHVLPKTWHCVSIRNLSFSYNDEMQNLNGVSFNCKRGERIALVGKTGSGKTTFLKIFRALYRPQSLHLSVDGRVIHEGFEGIARAISLLPQDPEIFATTILENITLGAEYDTSTVIRATDMACFTDVANRLPNKFQSSIRERGVNLSGGQQQRLALARGFLASLDKDIVLLDEPTSSLDANTQFEVYRNIFREFYGKTIISTVHQLTLLPLFDRIYVFDQGRVVGSGTLNELLLSCSEFQKLYTSHA